MDKTNINKIKQLLNSLSKNGICFYDSKSKPLLNKANIKISDLFYQPHGHNHLEITCLLEGRSSMYINGHWYIEHPGQTRVFIPGTVHCEHFYDPSQPYRILWLTLFPQSIHFHATTYSQAKGYSQSMKRLSLSPPMCAKLWDTCRENNFSKDKLLQAKFHYLLMECLYYILNNDLLQETNASFYHEQVAEQIVNYIESYYWEDLSLEYLAGIVHYSPHHLNLVFKKHIGIPVHRYISEVRLKKSKDLLQSGEMLIKQIASATGFKDPLYFSRKFKQYFGTSPQTYQSNSRRQCKKQLEL